MFEVPDFKTCVEVVQALDDYLKHELPPEEEKNISEHLRLCEDCVRHFHFEESLVATIREKARRATAPPALRSRLLKMLDGA